MSTQGDDLDPSAWTSLRDDIFKNKAEFVPAADNEGKFAVTKTKLPTISWVWLLKAGVLHKETNIAFSRTTLIPLEKNLVFSPFLFGWVPFDGVFDMPAGSCFTVGAVLNFKQSGIATATDPSSQYMIFRMARAMHRLDVALVPGELQYRVAEEKNNFSRWWSELSSGDMAGSLNVVVVRGSGVYHSFVQAALLLAGVDSFVQAELLLAGEVSNDKSDDAAEEWCYTPLYGEFYVAGPVTLATLLSFAKGGSEFAFTKVKYREQPEAYATGWHLLRWFGVGTIMESGAILPFVGDGAAAAAVITTTAEGGGHWRDDGLPWRAADVAAGGKGAASGESTGMTTLETDDQQETSYFPYIL